MTSSELRIAEPQIIRPLEHIFEVRPMAAGLSSETSIAWQQIVATLAAWRPETPYRPVLERRFGRTAARGPMTDTISVVLDDPLGIAEPHRAQQEIVELLRPLAVTRALAPLSLLRQHRIAVSPIHHIAELAELDDSLPEGQHALLGLFESLVHGLEGMKGAVGLAVLVSPARTPAPPEPGDGASEPWQARRIDFRFRLFSEQPMLDALLSRAEAMCLARRPTVGQWWLPETEQQLRSARLAIRTRSLTHTNRAFAPDPVSSRTAAIHLSLEPKASHQTSTLDGRPHAGRLPTSGARIGEVVKTNGRRAPYRLSWEARRLHVFISGASGMGKSTTILRMMLDDIDAGRSVVLVDPHGDLASTVARTVPASRLVHADPRLGGKSAAVDLMHPDPQDATSHLMGALQEVWPRSYTGPVFLRGISQGLHALHYSENFEQRATLADLERYFDDPSWRGYILEGIPNSHMAFARVALHEHNAWQRQPNDDHSMVSWLSSKLTPLTKGLAAPLFSRAPLVSLEEQLAGGAVVVIGLPSMGSETTGMVARMFLTRLATALQAQGAVSEEHRKPTAIYLDEAHLMSGRAMTGLFSQARKFNASVTVACQNPGQLEGQLDGVLANAQTRIIGRLIDREARLLIDRLGENSVRTLPTMPRYHAVLNLEDDRPEDVPRILTPISPPSI